MSMERYTFIPIEVIGKIYSFLELNEVKTVVYLFTVSDAAIIKSEYLKGSLHFLDKTNEMKCWKKRRDNTILWMKHNEWKDIKSSHDALQPFVDINKCTERGILPVIQHLVEDQKIDVNSTYLMDNSHFEVNVSPLLIALQLSDVSILKYLLQLPNIDVNTPFQTTFRNSVLHYAAADASISYEHFSLLLDHAEIRVDVRDAMGKTPLHYCCWILPPDCERKVQSLIRAGSNVNAIALDSQDPLQVLTNAALHKRKNVDDVEFLLRQAGAIEVIVGP